MTEQECPMCGTPFCSEEGQDETPYLLDCGHSLCRRCCARLRSLACPRCSATDTFDAEGPVFRVVCPLCHKDTPATDESGRLRMDYVTASYIANFGSAAPPPRPPAPASPPVASEDVVAPGPDSADAASAAAAASSEEGVDSAETTQRPQTAPATTVDTAETAERAETATRPAVEFPAIPRTVPGTPPRPAKRAGAVLCVRHRAEQRLYCRTCQTLCCPLCAAPGGEHCGHAVALREQAQREAVETLRENLARLQAVLPVATLAELRRVDGELGAARDRVAREADAAADAVKDAMDHRKEELLESLDGQIDSLVGGLQAQADLLKEAADRAERLIARSNAYLVCMDANVAKVPEIVRLVWDLYNLRPELEQLSVQYIPPETQLRFQTGGNALMTELKNYGQFSHQVDPDSVADSSSAAAASSSDASLPGPAAAAAAAAAAAVPSSSQPAAPMPPPRPSPPAAHRPTPPVPTAAAAAAAAAPAASPPVPQRPAQRPQSVPQPVPQQPPQWNYLYGSAAANPYPNMYPNAVMSPYAFQPSAAAALVTGQPVPPPNPYTAANSPYGNQAYYPRY